MATGSWLPPASVPSRGHGQPASPLCNPAGHRGKGRVQSLTPGAPTMKSKSYSVMGREGRGLYANHKSNQTLSQGSQTLPGQQWDWHVAALSPVSPREVLSPLSVCAALDFLSLRSRPTLSSQFNFSTPCHPASW